MPIPGHVERVDPLAALVAGAMVAGTERPMPLVSTDVDVSIDAGLAVVSTRRTFRNVEAESIEATITFPIPVNATLFALEARIAGRTLKALARPRDAARETYEDAIDRGRTAVLHEEVLRGVHMLSVGHVPAGAVIEVTTVWSATLTIAGDGAHLRIPLTVGDVYGRSGLSDADDLIHGGTVGSVALTVRGDAATIRLRGGTLTDARAAVPSNAPIDLEVSGWTPRALLGRAADGRQVALRVTPLDPSQADLEVAILVDHSGSMAEPCGGRAGPTKHEALVDGLRALAATLREGDAIDLWEFDDKLTRVYRPLRESTPSGNSGGRFSDRVDRLSTPSGGTEIGSAIAGVIARCPSRDILLITDGKSHAIDVHALVRSGRRVVAVLVGEDSLDAQVGHLAVLTGGDVFVSDGSDVGAMLSAAIATLRRQSASPQAIAGRVERVTAIRGNARILAEWHDRSIDRSEALVGRAVVATAASLALPALDAASATALAVAEGLVTHLTSLVLVDEAGAAQEGLPVTRKIALPSPTPALDVRRTLFHRADAPSLGWVACNSVPDWAELLPALGAARSDDDRANLVAAILWDGAANDLLLGDLSTLDAQVADAIRAIAAEPALARVAYDLGMDQVVLAIGMLAWSGAGDSRSAARIARKILGAAPGAVVVELMARLGIPAASING